jgi:hypothetical protein
VIIQAAPYPHYSWLWQRVGCVPTTEFKAIEAIDPVTREVVAMVGYDPMGGNCVQMHFAFERPCRRLLIEAFTHIFKYREAVIGWVPANDTVLRDKAKRIGFKEINRVKDGMAPGIDMVLVEMHKSDCKFIRRD